MRTRAVRDGDDWILVGTRMWITNGGIADVATVWAQTEDGIRSFLVLTGTPGFTARTSTTSCSCAPQLPPSSFWTPCGCPQTRPFLPVGTGLSGPLRCLNEARYGIVWGAIGPPATAWRKPSRTQARTCRTVLGGSGTTLEYSVLRHANNPESVLTYEITSEVHQLVVGQALTGISAYR